MLVICGSDFGMINDTVLSYSSPLYGRRTRDILLGPLDLNNSLKFTAMPFEEVIKEITPVLYICIPEKFIIEVFCNVVFKFSYLNSKISILGNIEYARFIFEELVRLWNDQ